MKRILAGVIAALLTVSASAASLYPLGMMNPVGSTSGQVVTSTGPTTPATWSTIGALGYATLASPAFTGIPTAPTAALNTTTTQLATTAYVVNQGYLTINLATSTYAPLASPSFTGSPVVPGYLTTASATSTYAPLASPALTGTPTAPTATAGASTTQLATTAFVTAQPTINQPNIVGVTAATNASAGSVGESPTPTNLSGVSLTNATAANVASISLGPGIWFVQAIAQVVPAGTTVISNVVVGVSTTSATQGALGSFTAAATGAAAGFSQTPASPWVRVPLGSTTTVFAIVNASFSVSTCTANGFISALRVH
jgi:hypothetical protein